MSGYSEGVVCIIYELSNRVLLGQPSVRDRFARLFCDTDDAREVLVPISGKATQNKLINHFGLEFVFINRSAKHNIFVWLTSKHVAFKVSVNIVSFFFPFFASTAASHAETMLGSAVFKCRFHSPMFFARAVNSSLVIAWKRVLSSGLTVRCYR